MFSVLRDVHKGLRDTITAMEEKWSDNPRDDYYFHQITGVQKAIEVVKKAQAKELLELDRWAQLEMRREIALSNKSPKGKALSD